MTTKATITFPTGWHSTTLRRHLAKNDSGVWGEDPLGDEGVLVLRSTEQTVDGKWNITDPALRLLSARERSETVLRSGDLVVTKSSGSALHIGKTTLVEKEHDGRYHFGNFMQRLCPRPSLNSKYLWYLLNSSFMRTQVRLTSTTTTGLANLNGTLIGRLEIPVPPVTEQLTISDFLDRETAKIDALIEKQHELVALLHERRSTVIDESLAAFKREKLRRWWIVTDCKHVTAEFVPESSYPVASIGQLLYDEVDLSDANLTTKAWFDVLREPPREPLAGDLLMSRNASIGKVSLVTSKTPPFALGQDVVLLRARDDASAPYLKYALQSSDAKRAINLASVGSTFKRINISQIKAMQLPFAAADEQGFIANNLDQETAKIDALIAKAEEHIALAQERRAALITAAVTGQIDVRKAS